MPCRVQNCVMLSKMCCNKPSYEEVEVPTFWNSSEGYYFMNSFRGPQGRFVLYIV